jgi:hypothetical protein
MGRITMTLMAVVVLACATGLVACTTDPMDPSSSDASSSMSARIPKGPTDTRSGPAYRTVSGTVLNVEGPYYDVEEYNGNMIRLHVSSDTIKLNGSKGPGDSIRAEITRGGHANSIQ